MDNMVSVNLCTTKRSREHACMLIAESHGGGKGTYENDSDLGSHCDGSESGKLVGGLEQ